MKGVLDKEQEIEYHLGATRSIWRIHTSVLRDITWPGYVPNSPLDQNPNHPNLHQDIAAVDIPAKDTSMISDLGDMTWPECIPL